MTSYWYPHTISIKKLNDTFLVCAIPSELEQFKGLDAKENSNIDKYIQWIERQYPIKVEYVGVQDNKVHFKEKAN